MTVDPKVLAAQNEVEVKRAQFMTTTKYALGEAKRRLAPDLIAEQAWKASMDAAKNKGKELAHRGENLAKDKPWLVGGIAAAVGLFLARKPVAKLASDAYDAVTGEKPEVEAIDADFERSAPDSPVAIARRAKRVEPKRKRTKPKVENVK